MADLFTNRELDIMAVLWERGPSTVAEVREALADELAYTTVLTVLRVLEEKGRVDHREEGRAHRYRALVPAEEAGESAVRRLVAKVFAGKPERLLAQLVSDRRLSESDLRRMRELLEERLEGHERKEESGRREGEREAEEQ